MTRKYQLQSLFLAAGAAVAVLSVAVLSVAEAEVACVADVSYRWVKEGASGGVGQVPASVVVEAPSSAATSSAASAATEAGAASSAAPAAAEQRGLASNEQRVRFATIERRGKDEGSVRSGLLVEVNRQKARAHERCKRDHESFGDCVSTKLSTRASTLNSLSFSARSKVEEALIEECKVQQGRCVAIDSGEPTCRQLAGAGDVASAGVAAEAPQVDQAQGAAEPQKADKPADKAAGKPAEAAEDKAKSGKKKG